MVEVISRGTVVQQRFEANPIAYQDCSIDATKVNSLLFSVER